MKTKGEGCLSEDEIDFPDAESAGVTDLGASQPCGEGLGLANALPWPQTQLNKPVIGQIPAKVARSLDSASTGSAGLWHDLSAMREKSCVR